MIMHFNSRLISINHAQEVQKERGARIIVACFVHQRCGSAANIVNFRNDSHFIQVPPQQPFDMDFHKVSRHLSLSNSLKVVFIFQLKQLNHSLSKRSLFQGSVLNVLFHNSEVKILSIHLKFRPDGHKLFQVNRILNSGRRRLVFCLHFLLLKLVSSHSFVNFEIEKIVKSFDAFVCLDVLSLGLMEEIVHFSHQTDQVGHRLMSCTVYQKIMICDRLSKPLFKLLLFLHQPVVCQLKLRDLGLLNLTLRL